MSRSNFLPPNFAKISNSGTGFVDRNIGRYWDNTTRRFILTGNVKAYYKGSPIKNIGDGFESPSHPADTNNVYCLYYNGTEFLWATNTQPSFRDNLIVGFVYNRLSNPFGVGYTQGFMYHTDRLISRANVGTYRETSIPDLSEFNPGSTNPLDRRPIIPTLNIFDEDVPTLISGSNTDYAHKWLTGIQTIESSVLNAEIIKLSGGGVPQYNAFDGTNYSIADLPDNAVCKHRLALLPTTSDAISQRYRAVWVLPQTYTQAANGSAGAILAARNIESNSLVTDLFVGATGQISSSYVFVYSFNVIRTGGSWYLHDYRKIGGNKFTQTKVA